MKKAILLLAAMIALSSCKPHGPQCNFIKTKQNSSVTSCLSSEEEYSDAIDNYNAQAIEDIKNALRKACIDMGLKIPESVFRNAKIIITDDQMYYNETYWQYVSGMYIPEKNTKEYDVFSWSAGMYQSQTRRIFINLTKNGVVKPENILIHEYTHSISLVNTYTEDPGHKNPIYWHDLRLLALDYLNNP